MKFSIPSSKPYYFPLSLVYTHFNRAVIDLADNLLDRGLLTLLWTSRGYINPIPLIFEAILLARKACVSVSKDGSSEERTLTGGIAFPHYVFLPASILREL